LSIVNALISSSNFVLYAFTLRFACSASTLKERGAKIKKLPYWERKGSLAEPWEGLLPYGFVYLSVDKPMDHDTGRIF
jgi:hypothetical protein